MRQVISATISLLTLLSAPACRTSAQARADDTAACRAEDPAQSAPARDGATPFDVATHIDFARYEAALSDYMAKHTSATEGDFCVIGFTRANDWRKAWVLWSRGGRVLEWAGGASEIDPTEEIDLEKDVVSSEAEIRGSTYLVTREWLNRLIFACDCFGRRVHVVATARP